MPLKFNVDFEVAEKNAISEIFPNTTIKYCYFHLKQSARSKLESLKCTDEETAEVVCFFFNVFFIFVKLSIAAGSYYPFTRSDIKSSVQCSGRLWL